MTELLTIFSFSIGIFALGVAILIYHNQSKQSNKIEKLVTEISIIEEKQQKILDEQEQFRKRRHDWAIHGFRSYLPHISYCIVRSRNIEVGKEKPHPDVSKEFQIKTYLEEALDSVKDLELILLISTDAIDPSFLREGQEICESVKNYCNKKIDPSAMNVTRGLIVNRIDDLIKKLPNPSV